MNFQFVSAKYILATILLVFLAFSFSAQTADAQSDPLTLAEVLTALQSKSSGLTIAQKNSFVTKSIQTRGVTFRLTPDLEKELRSAGANFALIAAIRAKSPRLSPSPVPVRTTTNPSVKFDEIRVQYNVTQDDEKGMRIFTKFTVSNMKEIPGYMAIYFQQKNGDALKTTNKNFSSKSGEVAVYRKFTPAYDPAVYKDFSVFMPYKELNLPPGDYNLKLDADLIYENGDLIQHLDYYEFTFKNPSPPALNTSNSLVTFDKMWIDYDITENRKLGMRVHVKINIKNMVGKESYLAIYFEKQSGDKLYSDNKAFRSEGGQTAVYRSLKPPYISTDYDDVQMFIPYEEFNLPSGTYNLRIHGDVIEPKGELIKHLNYYDFKYTR